VTPQRTTDPILDEIHRTRRAVCERFGGDVRAMLDDARGRQKASGRPVWRPQGDVADGGFEQQKFSK